jgi:hypothetical protein
MKQLIRKIRLRFHPFQKLEDDYLARLSSSITGCGMLHPGNIFAFNYALSRLPKRGALLEIGSFAGLSTNVLTYLMRKHEINQTLFTCDPWIYEGYHDKYRSNDTKYMNHFEGSDSITRMEYTEFIRESYIHNTRLFSKNNLPYTVRLTSDDFFHAWQTEGIKTDVFQRNIQLGGPLSFVYIDGDHSYETVFRDVQHALQWLVPGGWLMLDDSADYWNFGSVRMAKELLKYKNLKLVMKNPNYLFQVKTTL